jgi:2-hydroxymuconate-semialdehyde hydrolase
MTAAVSAERTTEDIAVGDVTFRVHQTGKVGNPAVLWLHGSGPGVTAMSNWERVVADLADEFHNIAPDIIGFGDSTHPDPAPEGVVAFTKLRVDTLLGLLDTLGLDKVSLVGNSMGGVISLALVDQAPERVERIVLMGSGGSPVPITDDLYKVITFYRDATPENMADILSRFVHDPSFFGDDLAAIAAARMPQASRDDVRRSHLATFKRGEPLNFDDEFLGKITQPTLVTHGRSDRIIPVASSYYFAERIPNASLHVFPNAGHWLQLEQPRRFANLVRTFLLDEI